jgi:hypothetical protein
MSPLARREIKNENSTEILQKLYLEITRFSKSKNKKRQRWVQKQPRKLIERLEKAVKQSQTLIAGMNASKNIFAIFDSFLTETISKTHGSTFLIGNGIVLNLRHCYYYLVDFCVVVLLFWLTS